MILGTEIINRKKIDKNITCTLVKISAAIGIWAHCLQVMCCESGWSYPTAQLITCQVSIPVWGRCPWWSYVPQFPCAECISCLPCKQLAYLPVKGLHRSWGVKMGAFKTEWVISAFMGDSDITNFLFVCAFHWFQRAQKRTNGVNRVLENITNEGRQK